VLFLRPSKRVRKKSTLMLLNLHLLRALAALAVVYFHATSEAGLNLPINIGGHGVDVFFVISGFIIAYIGARTPERFFVRRLIRIVPFYWAATLAVFAAATLAPHLLRSTRTDVVQLLCSLFFIPRETAYAGTVPTLVLGWSLNYEMYFYVVFALALVVAPRRAPIVCSLAIAAGLRVHVRRVRVLPLRGGRASPRVARGAAIASMGTVVGRARCDRRDRIRGVSRHLRPAAIPRRRRAGAAARPVRAAARARLRRQHDVTSRVPRRRVVVHPLLDSSVRDLRSAADDRRAPRRTAVAGDARAGDRPADRVDGDRGRDSPLVRAADHRGAAPPCVGVRHSAAQPIASCGSARSTRRLRP
jgi:hypothetical protein